MKDLMIDIETLGTRYGSVITQIGAVQFDRFTGKTKNPMQVNFSITDALQQGFTVDGGTLEFWFAQKRRTFLENPRYPAKAGLEMIRNYYRWEPIECVWSHATFDFGMIQDACQRLGILPLWHFRKTKDIRTLMELADTHKADDAPPRKDAHDALSDCMHQVKYCVKAFRKLRRSK